MFCSKTCANTKPIRLSFGSRICLRMVQQFTIVGYSMMALGIHCFWLIVILVNRIVFVCLCADVYIHCPNFMLYCIYMFLLKCGVYFLILYIFITMCINNN